MYNTSSTSPAAAIGRRLFGTVRRRSPFFKALAWMLAVQMAFFGLAPAALAAAPLPVPDGWDASGYVSGSTMSLPHGSYNWNDFSIASGNAVEFTGTGTALNKVTGGIQSEIYGRLTGDNVFLLNPAGILFGNGASVDVNGLIAAAASMTEGPDGFTFTGIRGDVSVAAGATINASSYAYLVGRAVHNGGTIQGGCVSIAATADAMTAEGETADSVTIATAANGAAITFNFADPGAASGADGGNITHSGEIQADTVNASAVGDVTGDSDSAISAGGNLAITAGGTTGIRILGTVLADGEGATATLTAPEGAIWAVNGMANDFATLSATAKGVIDIEDKDDLVVSKASSDDSFVTISAIGDLTVQGDGISARYDVSFGSSEGKVVISAPVAGDTVAIRAGNGVEGAGAIDAAGAGLAIITAGDINLTGTLLAENAYFEAMDVSVCGADNDFGAVEAYATDGSVAIRDANDLQVSATATENIRIDAGGGIWGDFSSTISAGGDLAITAGGEMGIRIAGTILADGEGATATLTAPEGNIYVGNPETDLATLSATAKGNIVIYDKDDLVVSKASSDDSCVDIRAIGDLTVQGDGISAGGDVSLHSSEGKLVISAPVAGGNTTYIYGNNGVEGAGALGTAGAFLGVDSEGDINLTGTVLAEIAVFEAKDVSVYGANNDFTGFVVANAMDGSVAIRDANDLSVVFAGATEDIRIVANGALETVLEEEGGVSAGGNALLKSETDTVTLGVPVTAGQNLTISSGGATTANAGATLTAGGDLLVDAGGDITLGDAATAGNTMALLSGGGITTGGTTAELLYTESAAGTTVVPDTPGVALTVTEVLEDPTASTATRVLRPDPGPGPGPGPGPSPEPPTPEPPAPVPAAPTDGGKTPSRTTATAEALPAGGVPPIADDPQAARELNRALAFMVGTTDTAAGADPATAAGAYPGATLPGGVDTLRFGVATGLLAGFQTAPLGQGWTPPPALTPTHLRALLSTPTLPPDTLLLAD